MRREEEAWYHLEWFIEFMENQGLITSVNRDLLLGDLDQFKAYAFGLDQAGSKEYQLPTDNPCHEIFCEDQIPTMAQKSQTVYKYEKYEENPHGLL